MSDTQDTGKALLREIDPLRRFFRQWSLYLLVVATIIAIISSPQNAMAYCIVALCGTNLLFLSVYAEEAVNSWLNRLSETLTQG